MLFCDKKIDFHKITKTILSKEVSSESETNSFFIPCCSSRKNVKNVNMQILKSEINDNTHNVTASLLSKELQECLSIVTNNEKHYVEAW